MITQQEVVDRLGQAIKGVVAHISSTVEPASPTPEKRAKEIIQLCSSKSALVSGTLALPPGPMGFITIIPDLVAIWKIQNQMIADIAAAFNKYDELSQEQMLYCLFKHTSHQAVTDLFERVGDRLVLRKGTTRMMQKALEAIALRVVQRVIRQLSFRWIPVIGAAGVAGYAFYDTNQVGQTAIEFFKQEIFMENLAEVPSRTEAATTAAAQQTATFYDGFTGAARASSGYYITLAADGRLVATAKAIGDTERFRIVDIGGGRVGIRAENGKYVYTDLNRGGLLVAAGDKVGDWEAFRVRRNAAGSIALQSCANNLFVVAPTDGDCALAASSAAVGDEESFALVTVLG